MDFQCLLNTLGSRNETCLNEAIKIGIMRGGQPYIYIYIYNRIACSRNEIVSYGREEGDGVSLHAGNIGAKQVLMAGDLFKGHRLRVGACVHRNLWVPTVCPLKYTKNKIMWNCYAAAGCASRTISKIITWGTLCCETHYWSTDVCTVPPLHLQSHIVSSPPRQERCIFASVVIVELREAVSFSPPWRSERIMCFIAVLRGKLVQQRQNKVYLHGRDHQIEDNTTTATIGPRITRNKGRNNYHALQYYLAIIKVRPPK